MITVFLDFDGVLNTYKYRVYAYKNRSSDIDNYDIHVVDPELLTNLETCIKSYENVEFEIVISSTWRKSHRPHHFKAFLGDYLFSLIRMEDPFTPHLGNREKDIKRYIDEHSITDYVIIDDIRMDSYFMRHRQVLTDDYDTGFDSRASLEFKAITERILNI